MPEGGRRSRLKMMTERSCLPLFESPDALRTNDEVFDILKRFAHVSNYSNSPQMEVENHNLIILDDGHALSELPRSGTSPSSFDTSATMSEREKVLNEIRELTEYDECYVFNGQSWFNVVMSVEGKLEPTPMPLPLGRFVGGDKIMATQTLHSESVRSLQNVETGGHG